MTRRTAATRHQPFRDSRLPGPVPAWAPSASVRTRTRPRTWPAVALVAPLAVALAACGDDGSARASLSVAETLADADTAGYARAVEPRTFTFPADHGPHPDFKHEWWYFTGNLEAVGPDGEPSGRDFGFQLTFFRSALSPDPPAVDSDWSTRQAYMAHFALTDVEVGRFHAFERFDRGAVGLAGAEAGGRRVWVGDWEGRSSSSSSSSPSSNPASSSSSSSRGVGEGWEVRAEEGGVGVELVLESVDPIVLQGDEGLSAKGAERANASYYYSMMRLRASGTIRVGGVEHAVEGLAWLDREWSTSALSPGVVGWDWFSLQLDDDSELMLYRLRTEDGGTAPFSAGTFVAPDGATVRLGGNDFDLEETGTWRSPRGGTYPSGWRIRVPELSLELRVTPRLADQELDLAFRYWEGAVAAEGSRAGAPVAGRGYVELTGYAEGDGGSEGGREGGRRTVRRF